MKTTILAERLKRQRLTHLLRGRKDYLPLFRMLQPVSPVAYSYPGSPPGLVHRTTFDHQKVADKLRADRTILKGRFLGGGIGYVCADDLAVYATAFRKSVKKLNYNQQMVLEIVRDIGPLSPRQIKEESQLIEDPGLLNKEIMPALHRMQEAFVVFEDQPDNDWERNWGDFEAEWPDVNLDAMSWEEAASEVVKRFLHAHVFATLEQIKDWSCFNLRSLKTLLSAMEAKGDLLPTVVDGLGEGWLCTDAGDLKNSEVPPSVLMMHRADPLVKSHSSELKDRFGGDEVLQYLLIDGEFAGAVLGHWRIGPHDVDDILLELPAKQRSARKAEIVDAVAWNYHPPHHNILAYDGKAV